MAAYLWIRFYADLNDLVAPSRRGRTSAVALPQPAPLRDVIERLGVPHTEVGLVLVDGDSADLSRRLAGGERVSVFPPFRMLDVAELRKFPDPQPAGSPRFVADGHLGTLARLLRMLGVDTAYDRALGDAEIALLAGEEGRIVLTRDRGLLKRSAVPYGHLVRSDDPDEQIREVVERYSLERFARPLTRCLLCNGELVAADESDVADCLQANTRRCFSTFRRCAACGQVYWEGSHVEHMRVRIRAILGEGGAASQ